MKSLLFCLLLLTAGLWLARTPLRRWADQRREAPHESDARGHDWRAGRPESVSGEALARLGQDRRVRQQRLLETDPEADLETGIEAEFTLWWKQFEDPVARQNRLAGQRLDEAALRQRIRAAQLDQAWIEARIARESSVTETEVRAWVEQHRDRLRLPLRHRVAHLFLAKADGRNRRAELQTLAGRLQRGETAWAKLVQAHSEDLRTRGLGGDLGWLSAERLPAEFTAAVAALPVGATSGPVETRLGWHLLRVLERQPARPAAFDEVRGEVEALLQDRKRAAALERLLAETAAGS